MRGLDNRHKNISIAKQWSKVAHTLGPTCTKIAMKKKNSGEASVCCYISVRLFVEGFMFASRLEGVVCNCEFTVCYCAKMVILTKKITAYNVTVKTTQNGPHRVMATLEYLASSNHQLGYSFQFLSAA